MVQRSLQASYLPGWYVFPGGTVGPSDADPRFHDYSIGLHDQAANRILQLSDGALTYWVTALRECFEEVGLLLAYERAGGLIKACTLDSMKQARARLANQEQDFLAICRTFDLKLAIDRAVYFAHWITHEHAPRRFDARFFAAVAPDGQLASHDNVETIGHLWIPPAVALQRERAGEMKLAIATRKTLELLAAFNTSEAFMRHLLRDRASLACAQYTN